jgi:hypothetical protein
MNSLLDIRIFLGLVPKESPCIVENLSATKGYRGILITIHSFWATALIRMSGHLHAPAALFPWKYSSPLWIGGYLGPREQNNT